MKAVFFDVANTLLYKPDFYGAFSSVLNKYGVDVDHRIFEERHRIVSEIVEFPDKTSQTFYREFNTTFLYALGIKATEEMLSDIFAACSYLPWKAFPDTDFLSEIKLPLGIISNWDRSLADKLSILNISFEWMLGSGEEQVRKPDKLFYEKILTRTGFKPDEILYVGDSVKLDVIPALQIGINAVLIDRINLYPKSPLKRIMTLAELKNFL